MLASHLSLALLAAASLHSPAVPLAEAAASQQEPLRRAGLFGAGVALQPITLGLVQAFSDGESAVGVQLLAALQIDLGKRLALRLPVDLVLGGSDDHTFVSMGFTPGLLYRFRSENGPGFVPYFGGGFKLGAASARVGLLGIPTTSSFALSRANLSGFDLDDLDDGDGDGGEPDPDLRTRLGAFPELWAGAEWHLSRLFCVDLGLAYTYYRMDHRGVHQLSERIGLRFSF